MPAVFRLVALCALAAGKSAPPPPCPEGQSRTADTGTHCCWAGQAWSSTRNQCVGVPTKCPSGMTARGDVCAAPECPTGKSITADTEGHCCWPGQAWSSTRKACIGRPDCPVSLTAEGEECVPQCPRGQKVSADTQGRCCWPDQVWSASRSACVGVPTCPEGFRVEGDTCLEGCPDGQRVTAETQGHCCWPEQIWAASRGVCVGIPSCPPGWFTDEEQCLPNR